MKVGDLVSDAPKWINYEVGLLIRFTNKKKTRAEVLFEETGLRKVLTEELEVVSDTDKLPTWGQDAEVVHENR